MTDHKFPNSFNALDSFDSKYGKINFIRLNALDNANLANTNTLPISIKVLLEAVVRNEDNYIIKADDIARIAKYEPTNPDPTEIPFKPARVLMQDFTGVPAVVDLAAMRSAVERAGGDPKRINPLIPVDLVIDHSVMVDSFGSSDALAKNAELEFERNRERYLFLHWGQKAFDNFRVVPPASGICHQVNLEYLGKVVQSGKMGDSPIAYPDSLVGTDSHTTMINGLGIVGWGVGGIEAEAVMLGQPLYMLAPEVVGFKMSGKMPAGTTATDVVLRVTEILREKGVVGRFVEFYGSGLSSMSLTDRATIANMAPEYGATMGFFPVDDNTLKYMRQTGREEELLDLVERYCKEQGMFRTDDSPDPLFKDKLELNLETVEPSLAGPTRPQDRVSLKNMKSTWKKSLSAPVDKRGFNIGDGDLKKSASLNGMGELHHGDVVIAAITSCTNTSNPSVMLAAGLLAKKAVKSGLKVKPYVKTSLAPGSKMVTHYLDKAGLSKYLDQIGFNTVGYGCTTCIGNSGPLPESVHNAIVENNLITANVLSGNRNFTGRISPVSKASYLASPPLVVAYALAGSVDMDLENDPLGQNSSGENVYLRDIWPTKEEIDEVLEHAEDPETYRRIYNGIESSNETWNAIQATGQASYDWDKTSTYIQEPPFFMDLTPDVKPIQSIENARVMALVGDSITTDHISPAGAIAVDSPSGKYLMDNGIERKDFNSYGSRRGNDRVMTRGTFANVTFRNRLTPEKTGGWTKHFPSGEITTIYEASLKYKEADTPTIVLAGIDYGMGSSRDWAAKGTFLLGIRAVIAQSFERIHRSNLVGMGVLPLQFNDGENADSLGLTGEETFTIHTDGNIQPGSAVRVTWNADDGRAGEFTVKCRLDSVVDVDYYRNGGILQTVLRNMM